jgi:protein phosphatase
MAFSSPIRSNSMPHDSDTQELDYEPLVGTSEAEQPQPFSSLVQVDLGARTHVGKVRANNEDHFLAVRFGRSLVPLRTNLAPEQIPGRYDETGYALVVADGMGGAAAGEVASSLAITAGVNLALHSPQWQMVFTEEDAQKHMEIWRRRFRQIDYILTERAHSDPALSGMGTTLTVGCSIGTHLFLYYVGDSRAYLFREGKLYRLTRDHTAAQALADAGWIAPREVATHRMRHVLTKFVGSGGGDLEVDIQHLQLADGDRLLLCTDGLTDMVPDMRIAEVLACTTRSEDACRILVNQALEAGGKDNVTVVLARYFIPTAPAQGAPLAARAS